MSKFIFFDFKCDPCNHVFEAFVKPDSKVSCPKCNQIPAPRLVSAPSIELGGGRDPDFPPAYDKWEKTNRQKTAQDRRFHAAHGVDKKHHSYGS